jgi:hypothetical protein
VPSLATAVSVALRKSIFGPGSEPVPSSKHESSR